MSTPAHGGMSLTVERSWFVYPRGPFPFDGACWLRLYTAPGWRPVVILSDLGAANPGASVENAIEQAAAAAWAELLSDEPAPPVCITHFTPGRALRSAASFTLVTFDRWRRDRRGIRLGGVRWAPLTLADLAALIGAAAVEQLVVWQPGGGA